MTTLSTRSDRAIDKVLGTNTYIRVSLHTRIFVVLVYFGMNMMNYKAPTDKLKSMPYVHLIASFFVFLRHLSLERGVSERVGG